MKKHYLRFTLQTLLALSLCIVHQAVLKAEEKMFPFAGLPDLSQLPEPTEEDKKALAELMENTDWDKLFQTLEAQNMPQDQPKKEPRAPKEEAVEQAQPPFIDLAKQTEQEDVTIPTTMPEIQASPLVTVEEKAIVNDEKEYEQTLPEIITDAIQLTQEGEGEIADIYLNFEKTTLASVVNYLAEQRKINVIPDKKMDTVKVSLTTRKPLTLTRAWNVLLTLMDMHALSMIKVGSVYRIVPAEKAGRQPLPVFSSATGTEPENLDHTDQLIRYIYFFKNIKAETVKGILDRMLAENSVVINRDLEVCIITEKAQSIKSAMKIVKELDVGGLRESIKIIRLKHADASNVARLFNEFIINKQTNKKNIRFASTEQKKEAAYFSSDTKIIHEPVKNALILLGTQTNLDRVMNFIKKYLDVPIEASQSRLHTKEIKYADATKLKTILDSIVRPPSGQQREKSVLVGQFKFFEDVVIAAESPSDIQDGIQGSGNRLIVACNKDDWRRLENFIEKLDKPQPQVALEVMIVDTSSNLIRQLGAQIRNKSGWLGTGINGATAHVANLESGNELNTINLVGVAASDRNNGTFATLGNSDKKDVWAALKAVLETENTTILAQPFLVANNHEKCEFEFKDNKRVSGEINDPSKTGGARTRDIVNMTAQTNVELTPHINLDGVVNLSVNIQISEFQELVTGEPATNNRALKTQTSVGTGQVLILGGLTQSTLNEDHNKTPILAQIPILGNLFKRKRKNSIKQNLYIFIRPSIIKPVFEGKPDDYTELKLAYAKYRILGIDTYLKNRDPIQRWFFKPRHQSIKQRLADLEQGRFRRIDDFTQGKHHPSSVDLPRDKFYKTSYEIAKADTKNSKFLHKLNKRQSRKK